jgi:uncharacterized protein
MDEHPNIDILRRGYAAFANGDLDTINGLFADDIVWHVPGHSQISGDYVGKEQVLGFFGRLQETCGGTLRVDVHDLLASDEHGVAIVSESAERSDRSHLSRATHVFHLRDGQITEVWDAQVDQYSTDEFWA